MNNTYKTENEKFKKWFKNNGYKFKPETEDEADWAVVVRYWAWKAWEARALEAIALSCLNDNELY